MSFDFKVEQGDIVIENGDIKKAEDKDKLIQDILKLITTASGSNQFHPWYGSPISRSLVGSSLDIDFLTTIASSQLRNSLETLKQLQEAQSQTQLTSAEELLAAVKDVIITRNQTDPRFFQVIIKVLTRSFTPVTTGFNMKNI
jgi:hypothetical protein